MEGDPHKPPSDHGTRQHIRHISQGSMAVTADVGLRESALLRTGPGSSVHSANGAIESRVWYWWWSPTAKPTAHPTLAPVTNPTPNPTTCPTKHPTSRPTRFPSSHPSTCPTSRPTPDPTLFPTPSPSYFPTALPTAIPSTPPTSLPTADPTVNTCLELSKGTRMLFQLNTSTSGQSLQPLNCVGTYCREYANKVISAHCDVTDVDVNDRVVWQCAPTSFLPSNYKTYNYTVACQQCPGRNTFFKTIGSCELCFHLSRSEIYPFAAAFSLLAGILLCLFWRLCRATYFSNHGNESHSRPETPGESDSNERSLLVNSEGAKDTLDVAVEMVNKNGTKEEVNTVLPNRNDNQLSPASCQKNVNASSSLRGTESASNTPGMMSLYQGAVLSAGESSSSSGTDTANLQERTLISRITRIISKCSGYRRSSAHMIDISNLSGDTGVCSDLNKFYGVAARGRNSRQLLIEFLTSNSACFMVDGNMVGLV
jgi:hypothetical protein